MNRTENYNLFLCNDGTKKFKEWREEINGTSNSNMVLIDLALASLSKKIISRQITLQKDNWICEGYAAAKFGIKHQSITFDKPDNHDGCTMFVYVDDKSSPSGKAMYDEARRIGVYLDYNASDIDNGVIVFSTTRMSAVNSDIVLRLFFIED